MASIFAAGHSDGSFERYIAPNFVNCGSTGSYGPRLGRRDDSCGFFRLGSFSAFGTAGTSCFSLRFSCFSQQCPWKTATLVLMKDSFLCPSSGQIPRVSSWVKKILFAAALLDETESSVGLSREQSSNSEGLLFSASDVEESDNEEESYKEKNANLDAVLDFVPCSRPDSDEGRG